MQKTYKIVWLALIVLSFLGTHGFAQDNNPQPGHLRDRQKKAMHSRDSVVRSLNRADTSVNSLLQRLEQYNTSFNGVNNMLSAGLDTADASTVYASAVRRLSRIKALANTHKSSTLRYLFVLRDNLDHLQSSLSDTQDELDAVGTRLISNQRDLMKFSKDSLLKITPEDSTVKAVFFERRRAIMNTWRTTDSANRRALLRVNLLQDRIATSLTNTLDESDQIDNKIKRFAIHAVAGEFGSIWDVDPSYNDFRSALSGTIKLYSTLLYYFFKNETLTHLAAIFFGILVFGWFFYNRAKTKRISDKPETILDQAPYLQKLPFICCLLVVIAIVPYFYDHPPVIFLEGLFLASIGCALILVKTFRHETLFKALVALFWLTIAYAVSNLLIEVTNVDRYIILLLSILSITIGRRLLKKVKSQPEEYLPNTGLALRLFIGMQFLSLFLNLSGRFSLAKIIGVTAVFNFWMLVTLFMVVQIILQGLFLQFQTKKDENSFISWVDYTLIEKKFKAILRTAAGLLWLFFLLQNLNIDDAATDYVTDILSQSRTVGGASFTFGGFVIFIGVIWLSSVLSRMVSYFYDVSLQHSTDIDALKKKNRTSTLLIRIGVFTVGFFLAISASNFPLDKITIIISAFGIGIGFGLQNIVNNLVSGLILAFEKPIQIGDVIEVDSRSGTIKEIGIRASKLATADGAEVIIPNADLIAHHVINWTLSNDNRRIEIIVGVAYGSDIEKVRGLLTNLLASREDIMSKPEPLVFLHNLNESSVDFRLLFWADDIGTWLQLKSNVLADIYNTLNSEGIAIPFPQQDVNLHWPEGQRLAIGTITGTPEHPTAENEKPISKS